jgi:hypothetical protein
MMDLTHITPTSVVTSHQCPNKNRSSRSMGTNQPCLPVAVLHSLDGVAMGDLFVSSFHSMVRGRCSIVLAAHLSSGCLDFGARTAPNSSCAKNSSLARYESCYGAAGMKIRLAKSMAQCLACWSALRSCVTLLCLQLMFRQRPECDASLSRSDNAMDQLTCACRSPWVNFMPQELLVVVLQEEYLQPAPQLWGCEGCATSLSGPMKLASFALVPSMSVLSRSQADSVLAQG